MENDSLKKINELYLGFSDAQNYAQRKNKQAFNDVFVKNVYLEELLNDNVFFLIGEKGTGKTAYATFLSNNFYKETKASTIFLSATDYEKFYTLKKNNNLDLTGFVGIWKVILLLIISKNITQDDKILSKFSKGNIDVLNAAIDEYYMNAFSPEITNVMKVIDESEIVAKLISKYAEVGGNTSNKVEFTETRMQHNLYYIEKNFSEAISKLKLNKDIVLFVDGIDIRPNEIQYSDYIECIRGLVDAAWTLNTSLMIELEALNRSFQLLFYIYDMISGMSRAFMVPLASSLDGVNLQKKFTPSLYREMQSVESFLRLRHNDHRLNYLTTISISGQPQSEFRHNRALLLRYW